MNLWVGLTCSQANKQLLGQKPTLLVSCVLYHIRETGRKEITKRMLLTEIKRKTHNHVFVAHCPVLLSVLLQSRCTAVDRWWAHRSTLSRVRLLKPLWGVNSAVWTYSPNNLGSFHGTRPTGFSLSQYICTVWAISIAL